MRVGRHLLSGALAGAVGAVAMDLLLYGRCRRGAGRQSLWRGEFAGAVDPSRKPAKLAAAMRVFSAWPGRVRRRPELVDVPFPVRPQRDTGTAVDQWAISEPSTHDQCIVNPCHPWPHSSTACLVDDDRSAARRVESIPTIGRGRQGSSTTPTTSASWIGCPIVVIASPSGNVLFPMVRVDGCIPAAAIRPLEVRTYRT
jgi:hypothetical protein